MVVSVFLFVVPFSLFKWTRRYRPDIISTKLNGLQHLLIHMTVFYGILGAGDCAAEARLTCRSVFRQTCLYGGRNRREIAA